MHVIYVGTRQWALPRILIHENSLSHLVAQVIAAVRSHSFGDRSGVTRTWASKQQRGGRTWCCLVNAGYDMGLLGSRQCLVCSHSRQLHAIGIYSRKKWRLSPLHNSIFTPSSLIENDNKFRLFASITGYHDAKLPRADNLSHRRLIALYSNGPTGKLSYASCSNPPTSDTMAFPEHLTACYLSLSTALLVRLAMLTSTSRSPSLAFLFVDVRTNASLLQ